MSKTFTCYLHKRGVMTPEVRTVTCGGEAALPEAILAEMKVWPRSEVIEVYNKEEEQLFLFTLDEHWLN